MLCCIYICLICHNQHGLSYYLGQRMLSEVLWPDFYSPILLYSPISSTWGSRVLSNFLPVHTEVLYVTVFSKWLVWRVRWWHQLQCRGGTHVNLSCMLMEAISICGKNCTLAGWPRELVYITGPCWYLMLSSLLHFTFISHRALRFTVSIKTPGLQSVSFFVEF